MGAIASGGVVVLNDDVLRTFEVASQDILEAVRVETKELDRRDRAYRGDRPVANIAGKTVILVDDGLATGSTMRAAIRALHQRKPGRIVVAVPVAAADTCEELSHEADEMICAITPQNFNAVGAWYRDFSQTSDEEVRALLAASGQEQAQREQRATARVFDSWTRTGVADGQRR